jgi:hypothetical protein
MDISMDLPEKNLKRAMVTSAPTADKELDRQNKRLKSVEIDTSGTPISGSSASKVSQPKSKCFRISSIPSRWTENDLVVFLEKQGLPVPGDGELSLYPACNGHAQTALLNLPHCPEHFCDQYFSHDNVQLSIDSQFEGLTPLNTPQEDILAEFVIPSTIHMLSMSLNLSNVALLP